MNPVIDAIMNRRHPQVHRPAVNRRISRPCLGRDLRALVSAEPWHFGVLTDRKTIDSLTQGRKAERVRHQNSGNEDQPQVPALLRRRW